MDEQEKKLEEQAPDTERQPEPQEDQSETMKETTEKIWLGSVGLAHHFDPCGLAPAGLA